MILPEIVVQAINLVDEVQKISLIKAIIPTYIKAEITKESSSRFRLTFSGWTGTCSYIATMSDPEKFIDWLKKKYKNVQEDKRLSKPNIISYLNSNVVEEEYLSKVFNKNLTLLSNFVKEHNADICNQTKDKIESILQKPSIFLWNTGRVKIQIVDRNGITKL